MLTVGATHVFVRGSNPDAVSAATAASEPATRRQRRPFPIAGIRDEFDDDDGDESGSEVGVLTREDVSWLKKQANEAAARDREVLERNLADRGVLVDEEEDDSEEDDSDADPYAARGENAAPPRYIFDEPATTTTTSDGVASSAVAASEPERAFEPEPAVAAAAEETRPEVASEGEREEDRQPRITPEMTYDEKQAEYARFAAEEAARNDRIAAEAAEAERAARERQEEEDRLADARAEEERRAIALDDAAADAAEEVTAETAAEETAPRVSEPESETRASEPSEPESGQASLAMTRSASRSPVSAEPEAGPGERLVVKVPDDVNEDAEAMTEPMKGGIGRAFDPKTRDRYDRAANVAGLPSRG